MIAAMHAIRGNIGERRINIRRVGVKRTRPQLTIRNLNDRGLFPRVHRFASDPNRFAIHSRVELDVHALLEWDGVVRKVVAVDRFEVGTLHGAEYYYEIKTVVWKRYQKQ